MHRVLRQTIITMAAAAAIVGGAASSAPADPPALPALTDIVGLCPPPLTGVMNAFSAHYNSFHPPAKVYCFNGENPVNGAVGDVIVTKGSSPVDTTCEMTRPGTDSAATVALQSNVFDQGHPCIDFVSSSRPAPPTAPPSLLWVPFAKDAVSWTTPAGGTLKPITLTVAQLKAIYTCVITNWNQVGGGNGTIVPVLPQPGSDAGVSFLTAIGVTTVGACVVNGSINIPGDPHNPVPIVEDTGLSPKDGAGNYLTGNTYTFATFPNAIFPYSVASWIAQEPPPAGGGHGTNIWAPGVLKQPQEINGVAPILIHAGGIDTINPAFPAAFMQLMWNIVRNAGTPTAPKIPPYLVPVFGPVAMAPHGLCSDVADITSYGFLAIGPACG